MNKSKKLIGFALALIFTLAFVPTTVTVNAALESNVTTISAGENHYLAIKNDGTLWAWGINRQGQLGTGDTEKRETPVKIMDGVIAASAGGSFSIALKNDGTLWAWGDNQFGQLGDGTKEKRTLPVKIMDDVTAISTYLSKFKINGTFGGSYAIKSDGSLWTWVNGTPTKFMDDVIMVSAGRLTSLAVKSDGTLWVWGYKETGVFNDVIYSLSALGRDKNTPIKIMDGVIAASAGTGGHSLAIKSDGTLWAWGYNNFGQLGDNTKNNKAKPVEVYAYGETFTAVSAGFDFSFAINSDGSLWAWGRNTEGQIANGTTTDRMILIPVKVIDSGVTAISTYCYRDDGVFNSLTLKSDGSLWNTGNVMKVLEDVKQP